MKSRVKQIIFNNRSFYKLFIRYKNINSLFYKEPNMYAIKDIIVCGVQRSGSTLLFNIINEVLKEKTTGTDTFFEEEVKYKKILAQERSLLVKKNHTYLPMVASRVKSGKTIGFFTHRDIRDIIVSSIQKGWINNFEEWINSLRIKYMINNSILYATTPNMHVISYEKLMFSREEAISEVAQALNIPLSEEAIEKIKTNTSINKVKKKLEKIPVDIHHEYTDQLHKNHIADGKIGKWKEVLSEDEIIKLTNYCHEYLDFFGYPTEIK